MAGRQDLERSEISRRDFLRKAGHGGIASSLVLSGVVDALANGEPSKGKKGEPVEFPRKVKTSSGLAMVQVPAGSFSMGDPQGEIDETPHKVTLGSFYVDVCPVTQREYERLTGENPARWRGSDNPVEQTRWSDAVRYCNVRSTEEGFKPCYDLKTWACDFGAGGYRLPTEAEWEYACRAGTTTRYSFGDEEKKLKHFAWMEENSGGRPRPVGKKLPNPWGTYDVHGNVWEWCNDFYKVDYYGESPEGDPKGPPTGDDKVLRGGCWRSAADECRSAFRYNEAPGYTDICFGYDIYGFRCVRNASSSSS